jgi:membrane protease YdiL (CAAX protease family)
MLKRPGLAFLIGLFVYVGFLLAARVAGGELYAFAAQSLVPMPLAALAYLVHLGEARPLARALTYAAVVALITGGALAAFGVSAVALLGSDPEAALATLSAAERVRLGIAGLGAVLSALAGLACLSLDIRRRLARFLPLEPESLGHAAALAVTVSATLLCLYPLLVLGEPPLFALDRRGLLPGFGDGAAADLALPLYSLFWIVLGALLAAGLGVKRSFRESLARLGLTRLSGGQALTAAGLGVAMVVGVALLSVVVEALFGALGLPRTDDDAFEKLRAFPLGFSGAVVIGLSAGLGEELAVRGLLQPRLGLLLSNLLFASLHVVNHHFDTLLVIFAVGLTFGLIRQRMNTTASAITHGVYDFVLVMLMSVASELPSSAPSSAPAP